MGKSKIQNPKSKIQYISAYEEILEGYLRTGEEAFLLESYELGKKMLKKGLSTKFIADMHFRSLEKVKRKIVLGEIRDAGHNPAIPFLELTMAFGLAFRDQLGALLRFTEIVEAGKRQWEKTFDAISDAISLHDSQGFVIRANKAFCDLLGKTFKEVLGQSPWHLFYDRNSPPDGCPLAKCLSYLKNRANPLTGQRANGPNLQPVSCETYIPKVDSYFIVTVTPVGDGAITPLFFLRTMKDITKRKKREKEEKEFQQKIRKEVALAEEREQRRIAQDIHDNLGHTLIIAKRKIQKLDDNLTTDSGTSGAELKKIANLLDQTISQTRTLTFDLYPPMLDDLGLIPTIEWYTEGFASKTGLKIDVIKTGKSQTLSKPTSIYLLRAVKELLNNILKHAEAHEVMLAIHRPESTFRIVIDDDGKGFNVEKSLKTARGYTGGIGFVNIRQWISDMDGRFLVESTPGQGTRVMIEVPIR
jgi:signal transduction histidine kinase